MEVILSVPAKLEHKCTRKAVKANEDSLNDAFYHFEIANDKSGTKLRTNMNDEALGDKLQRIRLENSNEEDNVVTDKNIKETNNDDIKLHQRLNLNNKISGNSVDTNQIVKELNHEALNNPMQRINVANNVRGLKVTTNQHVTELNHKNVYHPKTIFYPNQQFKDVEAENVLNDLNQQISDENLIKRLTLANIIEGGEVNTKQDIKLVNNDDLEEMLQRISLANNLEGNEVTTNQKVDEVNKVKRRSNAESSDQFKKANIGNKNETNIHKKKINFDEAGKKVIKKLIRLAMQNAIDGKKL